MYLPPNKIPISLFRLPNTLAGDAALTIVIQVLITWLVEWLAVTSDLRSGKVAPLAWEVPGRVRWVLGVETGTGTGTGGDGTGAGQSGRDTPGGDGDGETRRDTSTDTNTSTTKHETPLPTSQPISSLSPTPTSSSQSQPHPSPTPKTKTPLPLPSHLLAILLLLLPTFALIFPPSLGILISLGTKTPAGNDYVFSTRWTPQIFKLVLGGVLGVVVTPFMALFWVLREGLSS